MLVIIITSFILSASFLAAFFIQPWALANQLLWLENAASVYMQVLTALFTVFVMFSVFAGVFIIAGIVFGRRSRQ